MEVMDIDSIPKGVKVEIKKELKRKPEYEALVRNHAYCVKTRNYAMALKYSDAMKRMEECCYKEYVRYFNRERKSMEELMAKMSGEDYDMMNVYGNLLLMMVDIFDTLIMDTNQLLQKYHADYHIEMYDRIAALGKEAKESVLRHDSYASSGDKFYINLYGDTSDNMYKMCLNKSVSFMKKMKKHEERVNKKAKRSAKVAQGS